MHKYAVKADLLYPRSETDARPSYVSELLQTETHGGPAFSLFLLIKVTLFKQNSIYISKNERNDKAVV